MSHLTIVPLSPTLCFSPVSFPSRLNSEEPPKPPFLENLEKAEFPKSIISHLLLRSQLWVSWQGQRHDTRLSWKCVMLIFAQQPGAPNVMCECWERQKPKPVAIWGSSCCSQDLGRPLLPISSFSRFRSKGGNEHRATMLFFLEISVSLCMTRLVTFSKSFPNSTLVS